MPALDSKFSQFADGGDLVATDIVVGLRGGINTRFAYTADAGIYLPLAGGVMTGAIDMGSNLITNVDTPVSVGDAANKAYADLMLPLSGGTMSGAIAMGANLITGVLDPLANQDAATKIYVDTAIGVTSPLTTKGDLYCYSTLPDRLAVGSDGQILQALSSDATGLAYSTTTYPTTTTINQLLYSSAANVIAGLATGNSSVLVTSAGGLPYFSTSIPSGVTIADYLPLSGGTMSGAIDMNGSNISNIALMSFANSGFTVSFTATTLAENSNYVLPPTFPSTNGYILSSTTLGVMTWIANTAGSMVSVVGTANEIDVDATDPQNPILSLSATMDLSGTFNIQTTTAVNAILDEDDMVSDSAIALATQQSIKAYVDAQVSSLDITWSEQAGTSQAIAVQNGYILNNAALVTATLPATAAVGDIFELVGKGAGLFRLAQNASQTVRISGDSTTTGVGGSLTAVDRYASLQVICITSNTDFVVKSSTGNFTLV